MSKKLFKTNNGVFDFQFNDPILGFIMPLNFFVPLFRPELTKTEYKDNYHSIQKTECPHVAKPLPVRRLMQCNRVD